MKLWLITMFSWFFSSETNEIIYSCAVCRAPFFHSNFGLFILNERDSRISTNFYFDISIFE